MRSRRAPVPPPAPAPPTVPDLIVDPELAAIILLEHALDVAPDALLAEHPALIDDFRGPRNQGPVLALAHTICVRAAALRDILRRYRHAARDAAMTPEPPDDDIPF